MFLANLDDKSRDRYAACSWGTQFPPGGHAAGWGLLLHSWAVMSSAERRRLCVGMATYDDFDGVWFTVQAIGMYPMPAAFRRNS
jgi:hypothetical protein